ncbi:TIM barrel protein, partial [Acinetobacter baumannii]
HGDAVLAREQAARNQRLIEAAAELGAGTLVVIAGGLAHGPAPLAEARARVAAGVHALARSAAAQGVRLGLEMIHPSGILQKGCVNTIASALALARE